MVTVILIVIAVTATIILTSSPPASDDGPPIDPNPPVDPDDPDDDEPDPIIIPLPPNTVNVIGYYGNTTQPSMSLDEINDTYNILTFTFIIFEDDKPVLKMNGPYQTNGYDDPSKLNPAMNAWRLTSDPFGRQKHCVVSFGGATGHIPAGMDSDEFYNALHVILDEFHFDGVDSDLEGYQMGDGFTMDTIVRPAFIKLKAEGYFLTAAPEYFTPYFNNMKTIAPILDIFAP